MLSEFILKQTSFHKMAHRILTVSFFITSLLLPIILTSPTCNEVVISVHITAKNAVRTLFPFFSILKLKPKPQSILPCVFNNQG